MVIRSPVMSQKTYSTFPTVSKRYSPCVGKGVCMFVIVEVALCEELQ